MMIVFYQVGATVTPADRLTASPCRAELLRNSTWVARARAWWADQCGALPTVREFACFFLFSFHLLLLFVSE